MSNCQSSILELKKICKSYKKGVSKLKIIKEASFKLKPGELVALVGPSGAGKSTLLHIAGLLDRPTSGDVVIEGQSCQNISDGKRTSLRRSVVGFVYQFHHLLPDFTALENIILPQLINNVSARKAKKKAFGLLDAVGLKNITNRQPRELSGGEQQRVAIARALANDPKIILADEPTGNLDTHSADIVFSQFVNLARNHNVAAIIATHNPDLTKRTDRILRVKDGILKG
jgi:lipoprotein-releasing system ATP-binding protein